jgi:hypothetical protein
VLSLTWNLFLYESSSLDTREPILDKYLGKGDSIVLAEYSDVDWAWVYPRFRWHAGVATPEPFLISWILVHLDISRDLKEGSIEITASDFFIRTGGPLNQGYSSLNSGLRIYPWISAVCHTFWEIGR